MLHRLRRTPCAVLPRAALSTSAARSALGPPPATPPRVLVTGATGQIGMELVPFLRARYGRDNVMATDIRIAPAGMGRETGPYAYLDVTDSGAVTRAVVDHGATSILHLASLLSAVGERNPTLAMRVNSRGAENVFEAAAAHGAAVFAPSTIAVFGPSTPRVNTPNTTVLRPTTMYGTTKVYLELLGEYYAAKRGVDFRSLRYPGVISNTALPGGGTTDYAIEIFYEALRTRRYSCFLGPDTPLPMMYMPDCVAATVALMEAPRARLTTGVYNVTAASFTPADVAAEIRVHMPDFAMSYAPDFRQAIADSWPASIDDSLARADWGWKHAYGLPEMTTDMLAALSKRLALPVNKARV